MRIFLQHSALQIIQDMSLELSKHNQVAGHRDQALNESFRRQKSDLSRRTAEAEARVTALKVDILVVAHTVHFLHHPLEYVVLEL